MLALELIFGGVAAVHKNDINSINSKANIDYFT
jgi:hypothetical protein